MKPLLVFLLLAALCTDLARALRCCGWEPCKPLVACAPPNKYCVVSQGTCPSGFLVMKSCTPTCPNSTVSSDGHTLSVSCCQGSQCNSSAAAGLPGSLGALWASTSASLLWALLRAAW